MTYNEFEKLALNPPEDRHPSVFVLYVFRLPNSDESEYPEFDVREKEIYFSSKEAATSPTIFSPSQCRCPKICANG